MKLFTLRIRRQFRKMSMSRSVNESRLMEPPAFVSYPGSSSRSSWDVKLHRAVLTGKLQKIKELATRGCNVDVLNESGQTPLFCAAYRGSAEVVNLLLSLGASPNARCQPEGFTAVHGACYNGDPHILKMLLQAGGDLRLCDNQRRTPVQWADMQPDVSRQYAIQKVVDSARFCTTQTSGMEMVKEIQNCLSPRSGALLGDVMRSIFRKGVMIRDGRSKLGVHVNMDELRNSVHHTGFGKVYYGTGERCAAVIGIPYVSEISDLEDERDDQVPSWMSGKFTSFSPKYWRSRRTPVTVRDLFTTNGAAGVPDVLIHELEARSKLHHPNLLMLLGVCQTNNGESISLLFERVAIGSLFSVLHTERREFSSKFKADIVIQICDALEYVHAMKMIHCGLSSHSVVLVSHGTAKLSGFEYAVPENSFGEAAASVRHPLFVSDAYIDPLKHWLAPEVLLRQQYSIRSDVYALACIMFELQTGDIPWMTFSLENLRRVHSTREPLPLAKEICKRWRNVIQVGLRTNREQRDLEIEEIKAMMEMEIRAIHSQRHNCSLRLGGSDGDRASPHYFVGSTSPKNIHDAVDIPMCPSPDAGISDSETGMMRFVVDPPHNQGILKKFGRTQMSMRTIEQMVQTSEVCSSPDALDGELNEADTEQTSPDESAHERSEEAIDAPVTKVTGRQGSSTRPSAGDLPKKRIQKSACTQTEVRTMRLHGSSPSSHSSTSPSPVASPNSASTPLYVSLNGSKASSDMQSSSFQNASKKMRETFKERLDKLLQGRKLSDSGSSAGTLKSSRKGISIKPASHCSTGIFSAEDTQVPDFRNFLSLSRLAPYGTRSASTAAPAIKPAGHALGLEAHSNAIARKSRSHLDLPSGNEENIRDDDIVQPGYVVDAVQKFNAHSELLEKMRRCVSYSRMPGDMRRAIFQPQRYITQPLDFQRGRVPWGDIQPPSTTVDRQKYSMDIGSQVHHNGASSTNSLAVQCSLIGDNGFSPTEDIFSQDFGTSMTGLSHPMSNPNIINSEVLVGSSSVLICRSRKSSEESQALSDKSSGESVGHGAAAPSSDDENRSEHEAPMDTVEPLNAEHFAKNQSQTELYLTAQMSPGNSPFHGEGDEAAVHRRVPGMEESSKGLIYVSEQVYSNEDGAASDSPRSNTGFTEPQMD